MGVLCVCLYSGLNILEANASLSDSFTYFQLISYSTTRKHFVQITHSNRMSINIYFYTYLNIQIESVWKRSNWLCDMFINACRKHLSIG